MALETIPFDAAALLTTPEAQAVFLADALMTEDAGYIAHAIGVLARAQSMSKVAQDAGISRAALYKSLSEDGDPKLSTVLGVLSAMGLRLSAQAA